MGALSKREKVLRWFFREPLPHGVLSFDDVSLSAAQDALNVDRSIAEAYVQRYRNSLWKNFIEQCGSKSKLNIHPVARIIDSGAKKFVSTSSYFSTKTNKTSIRLSGRLGLRPHIYKMIDVMDDRSYEALCCVVCKTIGVNKVYLTPPGNEGGIDFVALIETRQRLPGFGGLNKFKIIGQAKKYEGTVTVGDVRDFNDTLSDVRRLSPPVKDHLPDWFRETHAPIVGWMVGHNGFQSGSESKSKMNGIMLMDSRILTEVLAFSRAVGHSESPIVVSQRIQEDTNQVLKDSC